jgi:hypothetical protein
VVFIISSWYNKEIKKADNPAVSPDETRGFPTPPHDGCGFYNFPGAVCAFAPDQKVCSPLCKTIEHIFYEAGTVPEYSESIFLSKK